MDRIGDRRSYKLEQRHLNHFSADSFHLFLDTADLIGFLGRATEVLVGGYFVLRNGKVVA